MVMSKEMYLAEAHKQLMDQRYYHRLDQDLTTHMRGLEQTLAEKRMPKLTALCHDRKQLSRRHFHRISPTTNTRDTDPPRTVVNLSNSQFSEPKISLLSKGLKYAQNPTLSNSNKTWTTSNAGYDCGNSFMTQR